MKKAQLSIETMIIYGLVILVALSVVGGLIYFKILDVSSYLPDKCDVGGTGDLKCEEMSYGVVSGNTELHLGIRNIGQKPIAQLDVSVTDTDGVHFSDEKSSTDTGGSSKYGTDAISSTHTLPAGEIAAVIILVRTGTDPVVKKVMRGELSTSYKYKDGAITQEATGSIRVKGS